MALECDSTIVFPRPLTRLVKCDLELRNTAPYPIGFKVKTTAPKQYCVRPNGGRIEANSAVSVEVILQPLDHEPAPGTKCRDKFLVQSTELKPELQGMDIADIWTQVSKANISERKIRCVYSEGPSTANAHANAHHQPAQTTTTSIPTSATDNYTTVNGNVNQSYSKGIDGTALPSTHANPVAAPSTATTQHTQLPKTSAVSHQKPHEAPSTAVKAPTATVAENEPYPKPQSVPTTTSPNNENNALRSTANVINNTRQSTATSPSMFAGNSGNQIGLARVSSSFGRPTSGAKVVPQIHNTVTVQTAFLLAIICFLIGLLF
ncbi:VAP family protein Scs22 [Schizosaccharomyces pombe]|uniref:Vesicle-associated membrane protein-associated protein scs22 n=1 Tax=Schizosaccharomyces pombe (strain 972 / ATCC 24843) TaxID=284812 RepID=SCS22_SCHPO|nr:VAMP/synaptobrevin-associated protein family protein [Schizosaccharomyces pombe]Q10484.2 RecName: Full=Vesicle-associated membrane protein-associated protein scs22; Short=VAMP-associated protein scs22 [Schizosaccharomyces pombe 972h-]CAA97357.1 VAP family protein (predicted) [Schizosaccharomyces pombe]|eukprot:NP_594594.1 VAMP/synaptobrevin-associated protein family protein [Schizosaccharomyces pombe]